MAKRGDELREHVLFIAKDVFLETGFERASMDVIAAKADTTKRSLYAHFENKEKLFLAVVDLVRGLLVSRLKKPDEYSEDTEEALVIFCGRFLEVLLWKRSVRMCRLTIAEVERFPDGGGSLYEAMFGTAQEWLEVFLRDRRKLTRKAATPIAIELLGRVLHPRFTRALFGLDGLSDEWLSEERFSAEMDLRPIRLAVAEILQKVG